MFFANNILEISKQQIYSSIAICSSKIKNFSGTCQNLLWLCDLVSHVIEINHIKHLVPMDKQPVEIVERKGVGHPDTICDGIGEKIALYFTKYYYERFGFPLHFNIDKCVLAGGRSQPKFGGGRVIEPILLHFVGRATITAKTEEGEEHIPIGTLVREAAFDWIKDNFRFLDPVKHVSVIYTIRPGSVDLKSMYNKIRDEYIPLANDTSLGVGFYPLSETEKICLESERFLNNRDFKSKYPATGEDIKIMCVRHHKKIHITVAMATVDSQLKSPSDYIALKEDVMNELLDHISPLTSREITIDINVADDPEKNIYYITVTGTSAEAGDDGQIGRGNRWNGLITPLRYMSIEAHAGKNPVSHVGKIYQHAAQHAAERIYKETHVDEVYILLVSTIGKPINQPQVAYIQYIADNKNSDTENEMREILIETLNSLPKFWIKFMKGEIRSI